MGVEGLHGASYTCKAGGCCSCQGRCAPPPPPAVAPPPAGLQPSLQPGSFPVTPTQAAYPSHVLWVAKVARKDACNSNCCCPGQSHGGGSPPAAPYAGHSSGHRAAAGVVPPAQLHSTCATSCHTTLGLQLTQAGQAANQWKTGGGPHSLALTSAAATPAVLYPSLAGHSCCLQELSAARFTGARCQCPGQARRAAASMAGQQGAAERGT